MSATAWLFLGVVGFIVAAGVVMERSATTHRPARTGAPRT